jgi:iron-sulfur cluster repair protein YtfE (RIC family)
MSSSITLSFSGQSCSGQSYSGPASSPRHPNRDWLPSEIVRHVVAVHHVNLRGSLGELQELRPRLARFAPLRGSRWDSVLQRFVKLHDALLPSLDWEAAELFPQLLHWHAEGGEQPPPAELLAACQLGERSHGWCLHMLWRLLCSTRDEMPIAACASEHRHFLDHLLALGSEYEQHLFEVECLLLPLIGAGVKGAQLPAVASVRR